MDRVSRSLPLVSDVEPPAWRRHGSFSRIFDLVFLCRFPDHTGVCHLDHQHRRLFS